MNNLLTIIIPAYNEEEGLQRTIDTMEKVLTDEKIPFNLIFIDDGSKDNTWQILKNNSEQKDFIKAIKFSRNFGKESAVFAGLDYVYKGCCIVMDCDLQHPPEAVVRMYKLWLNEGYEVVEAVKEKRNKESLLYRLSSKTFYRLLKAVSNINLQNGSDFKLLDARVAKIIREMPERQTFFRAVSSWVGFKTTKIYFKLNDRLEGETKWTFKTLLNLALTAITNYSSIPMQIVTFFGFGFFIFSFILIIQTLIKKFSGNAVEGFTTVIILLLITGSIIMISLGIIGLYLARIYNEIKQRPRYIAQEKLNLNKETNKN